jgi:hypothetical protein
MQKENAQSDSQNRGRRAGAGGEKKVDWIYHEATETSSMVGEKRSKGNPRCSSADWASGDVPCQEELSRA